MRYRGEADRLLLSDHGKDFVGQLGQLLHRSWQLKRNLSASISNTVVDNVYETAMEHGAPGENFWARKDRHDGISCTNKIGMASSGVGTLKHVPVN